MPTLLSEEPIAVVGSGCRFPGACSSPSKLWTLLQRPHDILKEFDPNRLNLKRFYNHDGDFHGSTDVPNKSYLLEEDSRLFDASFFGISPSEAMDMDPQQRLLLEVTYEALESAGMTLDQIRGSLTSVHVGVMTADYANIQVRDLETIPKYAATGTAYSILSNRISYVFDLKGASETIDTACSSSLVAVHHAARAILSGDSEMAIVAGVNLIFDPASYITESKLHMLSPDSYSRMWDKSANGYARGEGGAAIILKRLSQALQDGDHIEGIIRGSGVNSDGQSSGITMPSAPSQSDLICQTYRRAGLDPIKDRPQYFECHGTGTPAGDPVEARAIHDALLGDNERSLSTGDTKIYVGSIKSVIGHLEGCAGLAGLIKVLLAIKNRTIPPNLHFQELNPAITPFYGSLKIATTALPWPETPPGNPLRASVNSFGFGGTNAHVIVESFDNSSLPNRFMSANPKGTIGSHHASNRQGALGPLIFSAVSGTSLRDTVRGYLQYLQDQPQANLRDLSWLLQTRRSSHRFRAYFADTSRDSILSSMLDWVTAQEKLSGAQIGYQPRLVNPSEVPGILGIFTGQGAQWPAMGRGLILQSPFFRRRIEECEVVLRDLPENDKPKWSLAQELMADSASRINEAAISQPLCTAVQIALVDLLRLSGVSFHAVVGHSSGEIAATYAAGIITLQGAMQIAYYRGFYAKLAKGPNGVSGGMLAAGISLEDASSLCFRPDFNGRIQVAASNAPRSVTLSGDIDAILEAKNELDRDNRFARQLKVDTAYHSHHMQPCAEPYLQSLLECDIEVRLPQPGACIWNSSVRGDVQLLRRRDLSSLKGPYWVANMVKTVLFSKAVESSIWHGGPWDLGIEVGPHPALKGPVEQTIKGVYNSVPVYTGTLKRSSSDISAFSAALGVTWAQLGPSFVDFVGYRSAFEHSSASAPKMIKDLPMYPWDHDKVYWRESRISRNYRTSKDCGHELLGRRTPDDNDYELRWRNVLKMSEIPWLSGHKVFDEVLLPAAGYISMAVEAGRQLAAVTHGERDIQCFEVEEVDIHSPVVVPDDRTGVEAMFTMRRLVGSHSASDGEQALQGEFSYYICKDETIGSMIHTCTGKVSVHFNNQQSRSPNAEELLPSRDISPQNLTDVKSEQAYAMFEGLGLQYSGAFRTMTQGSRCFNYAKTTSNWPVNVLNSRYVVHPAVLDVAFQTVFIAHAHPATRDINTAFLPTHIDRLLVNPAVDVKKTTTTDEDITTETHAWVVTQTASSVSTDLTIYHSETGHAFLQVEGLMVKQVGQPDAIHDPQIFSKTVYGRDISNGLAEPVRNFSQESEALPRIKDTERLSLYYMKQIVEHVPSEERAELQGYHQRMFEAFEQRLSTIRQGANALLPSTWLEDQPSIVNEILEKYPGWVVPQIIQAVGENLADVVRGEKQLLEIMNKDDMLGRLYMDNTRFMLNEAVAGILRQISFKFPRCNIIEVGAGTGGTTWHVLNSIDEAYESYTFTDVSSGFFENAANKFSAFSHKMILKTLDIEKEPVAQGFAKHSYDVIIAANVLHVTRSLQKTLNNVRSLLRPGGYLIMLEPTGREAIAGHFVFGGLPGWWLSEEPGRRLGPVVSSTEWNDILLGSGFSGTQIVMNDQANERLHTMSLMISQAISPASVRLDSPLSLVEKLPSLESAEPLLIIGGRSRWVAQTRDEIHKLLLEPWSRHIQTALSIDGLDLGQLKPGTNIVCLEELDQPLFSEHMTAQRLANLQGLLVSAKYLVWVNNACKSQPHASSRIDPHAVMFQGISRVIPNELPHLKVQMLALETESMPAKTVGRHCVQALLRLRESGHDDDTNTRILWSHEPEIEILANGDYMIPREVLDTDMNQSYIASRRTVTKEVDSTKVAVQAMLGPSNKVVVQEKADESSDSKLQTDSLESFAKSNTNRVQVRYSLHIPQNNGNGIYLVCGQLHNEEDTSRQLPSVMAISHVNGSILELREDDLIFIDDHDDTPDVLASVAAHMMAHGIASLAIEAGSSHALLHAAELPLAALVAAKLASETAYDKPHLHLSSSDPNAPNTWIKIHPRSSKRDIQMAVPQCVQLFIDCTGYYSVPGQKRVGHQIVSSLRPSVVMKAVDASLLLDTFSLKRMRAVLRESYLSSSDKHSSVLACDCEILRPTDLAANLVPSRMQTRFVTDWKTQSSLQLIIQPHQTGLFLKANKTYLMVGCAGGLGMSICQWMIRNGAKYLVVTSRNPKVDPKIIEDAYRIHGATIRVIPMDVAKKESVSSVIGQITHKEANLPPIAGVCNAAMVLIDRFFVDMTVDQLNDALAPKVDGTENLDEAFFNAPLDFFIALSSAATIIGNVGQANYHIANLFMESIVARRRARGFAGVALHIGHVADTGYVAREGTERKMGQLFRNVRLVPLSEKDVLYAIENVIRPRTSALSSASHDTIIGLCPPDEPMVPGQERCHWLSNPRLSHFAVFTALQAKQANAVSSGVSGHLLQQVKEAANEEQAISVVVAEFCNKLESLLQLQEGSVRDNPQQAPINLGIDSLVAMELRTWFIKQLGADVPVVKILGGDTILQLCTMAVKKMIANSIKSKTESMAAQEQTNDLGVNNSSGVTKASVELPITSETDRSSAPESNLSSSSTNIELSDSNSNSKTSKSSYDMHPIGDFDNERAVNPHPGVVQSQPMSPSQARIWFASKHYFQSPTAYNLVFHYRVKGPLNMNRLRHALNVTTSRHDCLRMCFYVNPEDGTPMQGVMATPSYQLKQFNAATQDLVDRELSWLKSKVWNLETGANFAISVFKQDEEEHDIIFGYHHIVMDALGWHTFISDLNVAYSMRSEDGSTGGSHMEYSALYLEQEKANGFDEDLSFWQQEFAELPATLPLLAEFSHVETRPAQAASLGSHHEYRELDGSQFTAVKALCQQLNITPFHLHLTILQVFLACHTNTGDICVGVVDSNRSDMRFSQTVGCFINMFPIRFRVSRHDSFDYLAQTTRKKSLVAFTHAGVSIEKILERVKAPRIPGSTPLFQVACNYRVGSIDNLPLGDECRMMLLGGKDGEDPYDISWSFVEGNDRWAVQVHCQAALYSSKACLAMLDAYLDLLGKVLLDPHKPVDGYAITQANMAPPVPLTFNTTNGKLNGHKSKQTQASLTVGHDDNNLTRTEYELRSLWKRIIPDMEEIGNAQSSDFFLSGGNSLLLMQLHASIRECMGADISVLRLYSSSTLREMAQDIDQERTKA